MIIGTKDAITLNMNADEYSNLAITTQLQLRHGLIKVQAVRKFTSLFESGPSKKEPMKVIHLTLDKLEVLLEKTEDEDR